MPLSPNFILVSRCTFMTSHPSLYGQPLPGVRELFPGQYTPPALLPSADVRCRPFSPTTYDKSLGPSSADDSRSTEYSLRRESHLSHPLVSLVSNYLQMTNPSYIPTPYPSQLPPLDRSTAQDTAIRTADQRYTRLSLTPTYPRPQSRDHETQRWPSDPVANTSPPHVSPTYPSPEVSSPCPQPRPQQLEHGGANQSTLPYNRQSSSPMTPSPHVAPNPAEFPLRPSPFDQKSEETHSGKKRHKCDVCGSYWGRPSSLKIHMVSHTGVKGEHSRRLSGLQPN